MDDPKDTAIDHWEASLLSFNVFKYRVDMGTINHSYVTFHIVTFEPVNSIICRILCASGQR